MDTMFHLFTSDNKYIEFSVTCGLFSGYCEDHDSDVLWKVHSCIADAMDMTACVSVGECQCFQRAHYSKLSSQPSVEVLGTFIDLVPWRHTADVNRKWSKPIYGLILRTGLTVFFHNTDVYGLASYHLVIIITHSSSVPSIMRYFPYILFLYIYA
jgi:hypothetical protein